MERAPGPNPWPTVASEAAQSHGVISTQALLEAGATRRQVAAWVASGRLVALARGAYAIGGAPLTFDARVLAAVLVHGPETWASQRTAAALWPVPGFPEERRIHLLRPADGSNQRGGAVVHRSNLIPPEHVTVLRGIPVTTPARTLMDLAAVTGPNRLARAVAEAVRQGLCTDAGLEIVLARMAGRGRPGTRRLRAVLDSREAPGPTLSELEDLARATLRAARLTEPEWQVEMSDHRGWIGRVDGLYRSERIVLELDSRRWHGQEPDSLEDARRDERLTTAGYLVVRRTWFDLTQRTDTFVAEMRTLLAARRPAA